MLLNWECIILKLDQNLFLSEEKDDCQIESAKYNKKLSRANFDKEKQIFWAGYDVIEGQSITEAIEKILVAHGYALNLENFLAALSSFKFSNLVTFKGHIPDLTSEGHLKMESYKANEFHPAIQFKMPNKNSKGTLLDLFYGELDAHRKQAEELGSKSKDEKDSKKDLEKKIKTLEKEIDNLNKKLKSAAEKIEILGKEKVSLASSSANLPIGMKIAQVKSIDFEKRLIVLSSGRLTFRVPFANITGIPENESLAVVKTHGNVQAIFYPKEIHDFTFEVGTVLNKDYQNYIKVRRKNGTVWQIEASDKDEEVQFSKLKRKNEVVLKIFNNEVCGILKPNTGESNISEIIQEEIVKKDYIKEINEES